MTLLGFLALIVGFAVGQALLELSLRSTQRPGQARDARATEEDQQNRDNDETLMTAQHELRLAGRFFASWRNARGARSGQSSSLEAPLAVRASAHTRGRSTRPTAGRRRALLGWALVWGALETFAQPANTRLLAHVTGFATRSR